MDVKYWYIDKIKLKSVKFDSNLWRSLQTSKVTLCKIAERHLVFMSDFYSGESLWRYEIHRRKRPCFQVLSGDVNFYVAFFVNRTCSKRLACLGCDETVAGTEAIVRRQSLTHSSSEAFVVVAVFIPAAVGRRSRRSAQPAGFVQSVRMGMI